MQKCQNCHMPFSWSKLYKVFWGWGYQSIYCDNCGVEHRITISGRFIFASLTVLPMMLFTNFFTPFNNFIVTLLVGLTILMVGTLFVPYFVKFKAVL